MQVFGGDGPSRAEGEVERGRRTAGHVLAPYQRGATSLGSAGSRHGDAHRNHSRTRRFALQAANFSWSWPGKGGRGRGGGRGPSPALARARAIASRSLAISTSFIAPRQRGQVITSTANTRWSSHAHGCRFEGFVLPGEAQPGSSSVASPTNNLNCVGAAGSGTRPGTTSLRALGEDRFSPKTTSLVTVQGWC